MDVLTDLTVPPFDNPNLILDEWPRNLWSLLFDIFLWFEGPKVRDILAHGTLGNYWDQKKKKTILNQQIDSRLFITWTKCGKACLGCISSLLNRKFPQCTIF